VFKQKLIESRDKVPNHSKPPFSTDPISFEGQGIIVFKCNQIFTPKWNMQFFNEQFNRFW
jgi:hypothetical protein